MNTRQSVLKTICWAALGVFAVVSITRFWRGLGAVTALSDKTPWGLWIAFDVMAGVALAAGGFVVAATVYIFGRERYRPFARPAILTALLGYAAVAFALLYDLGLPWHIWHPLLYPQPHSVLFEVAMCVMFYLTILMLEFAPVVLEHPRFDRPWLRRIHRTLKRLSIPLVIAGIVLSTLHQSSLGSLFLITPYRVHPLWYSPIIWVLFLLSAMGLGLMMVTAESFFSAYFFGHKLRLDILPGLGRAASVVLFLYAGLRLGDIAVRGELGAAFDGSFLGSLFLFEILLSALVPATLLAFRRIRCHPAGLLSAAAMTIFGVIGYRFDVCLVAFWRPESMSYFPAWPEFAVSIGIVAGAILVFSFFAQNLRVYPAEDHAEAGTAAVGPEAHYDPAAVWAFTPPSLAEPRRYSLAFVASAALALAFLPKGALFGERLVETPVAGPRAVDGVVRARADGLSHEFQVVTAVSARDDLWRLLLIDGNRDGRVVLFPHDRHAARLGERASCDRCHHQNMPFDRSTSCFECHRDMYLPADMFVHAAHVEALGGNRGCAECHTNSAEVKARNTAKACGECHADMVVAGALVAAPAAGSRGYAAGYMDAMHGLCVTCHRKEFEKDPAAHARDFADCSSCHRDFGGSEMHEMKPYVPRRVAAPEREPRRS